MMTSGRDGWSKAEAVTVATIEAAAPALDEARSLLSGFQTMVRERRPPDLDRWIDTAARGLLAFFAKGLSRDRAAVAAALSKPWSNGQTEGQITRLKLVKRQMNGGAKLDLLEARLIGAG
ncbi:Transposase IS204/IS1001/IS1096/IS1165 DDE domain-containing protein [Methylorubrum extorquens]